MEIPYEIQEHRELESGKLKWGEKVLIREQETGAAVKQIERIWLHRAEACPYVVVKTGSVSAGSVQTTRRMGIYTGRREVEFKQSLPCSTHVLV